jgi:N-methylhydantoinase A
VSYKIGIDVGGTFTDFLLMDEEGNVEVYKTASTPADPSVGLMTGLGLMADAHATSLREFLQQVSLLAHGTTITTNAILTGTYSKTGLLTTKGHRDWLQTRRGEKPICYDSKEAPPEPVVPRRLRRVAEERVDSEGRELLALKTEEVVEAAEIFRQEKVEAVAITFLFSFLNPEHEEKAREILERELPDVYVSSSSKVLPQVRLYERGSTTVFNAAVGPVLRRYIKSLLEKLEESGFGGVLLIMQSNGGMMSPAVAMDFAVNSLLSGPAGAGTSGVYFGALHGCKDVMTIDMGGTSFDVCLIRDGEPEISTELDVAMFRMASPSIGIHTIGAGGGSIAWVDPSGMFRVGPQSAGASPGPACYGAGGDQPTVTDADLVLGYLHPDYFLGGRMPIYPEEAREAIADNVADKLGLGIEEAAYGVYKIVNTNMAQAVRTTSVNKGYDPRSALLVTAGGAGPVHACAIADELEVSLILVPKISSVFCATGMLISDIKHDFVRVAHSILLPDTVDAALINARLEEMKAEAYAVLGREGVPPDKVKLDFWADIRYEGQFNEIATPVPSTNGEGFSQAQLPALVDNFNKRHDVFYGYSLPGFIQELMSLRLTAVGQVEKPKFAGMPYLGVSAEHALKDRREIYWEGEWVSAPTYDGSKMGHGNKLSGPAIIEEPTTTIVVPPHWRAQCDEYGNYLIYQRDVSLEESLKRVSG